ncbi:hypothetical protein [Cytobacillus dafuensis]|uniref:Uncharacterized protein n=1 Tax=Cytobacillus dafuensis TaxID=1742359 RepID=A0A5B8Z7F8_CYTDA|nr:hypothetical protein [Cytobacillus dafuensis]QED48143.1 hypothetical protein FSZ17_13370 [Cytobacillus dafuensis]
MADDKEKKDVNKHIEVTGILENTLKDANEEVRSRFFAVIDTILTLNPYDSNYTFGGSTFEGIANIASGNVWGFRSIQLFKVLIQDIVRYYVMNSNSQDPEMLKLKLKANGRNYVTSGEALAIYEESQLMDKILEGIATATVASMGTTGLSAMVLGELFKFLAAVWEYEKVEVPRKAITKAEEYEMKVTESTAKANIEKLKAEDAIAAAKFSIREGRFTGDPEKAKEAFRKTKEKIKEAIVYAKNVDKEAENANKYIESVEKNAELARKNGVPELLEKKRSLEREAKEFEKKAEAAESEVKKAKEKVEKGDISYIYDEDQAQKSAHNLRVKAKYAKLEAEEIAVDEKWVSKFGISEKKSQKALVDAVQQSKHIRDLKNKAKEITSVAIQLSREVEVLRSRGENLGEEILEANLTRDLMDEAGMDKFAYGDDEETLLSEYEDYVEIDEAEYGDYEDINDPEFNGDEGTNDPEYGGNKGIGLPEGSNHGGNNTQKVGNSSGGGAGKNPQKPKSAQSPAGNSQKGRNYSGAGADTIPQNPISAKSLAENIEQGGNPSESGGVNPQNPKSSLSPDGSSLKRGQSNPAEKTEVLRPKKQEIAQTPSQLSSRRSEPVIEEQTGQIDEPTVKQSSGRISESTDTESTDSMNKSTTARPEEQKKESKAKHSTDWGHTPDKSKPTDSGKPSGIKGFWKKAITSLKQVVNPDSHDDKITGILEEIERESNRSDKSMHKKNKQQEVALQEKIAQINKVKNPLNKPRSDSDSKVHDHTSDSTKKDSVIAKKQRVNVKRGEHAGTAKIRGILNKNHSGSGVHEHNSISKEDMKGEITNPQILRKSTSQAEHAVGKDSVTATNKHAIPGERRIENATAAKIKGFLNKDFTDSKVHKHTPNSKNNKLNTDSTRANHSELKSSTNITNKTNRVQESTHVLNKNSEPNSKKTNQQHKSDSSFFGKLNKIVEGLNKHETHQKKHETPKKENHQGSGRSIISNQKPNNSQTPRKNHQGHSTGTGGSSSKGSYTLKPGNRTTVSYKGKSGRSGGSSSGRKRR